MKKYLIALAAVLLLAGQATALDPLENFQVENGFDENFYGGDIHEIEANFTNSKNIEVPLYVRLNVTNEDGLTGEEFDVNARINSSNSSGQRITDMSCQPLDEVQYQDGYRSDNNTIIYSCYENGNEIIGNSFNHLQVNATSDSRIVPGDYDFDLRMYSRIGEIENTGNTQGEVGSFSSDRATVSYNAIDEAYITYADYSKIYSSQPQSKFIEAVEVVSSPQSQQPTTCLPYIPDMSMQLFDYVNSDSYFFDRLKCQKADTNITGEVQFNYSGYNPSTTDIYKLENNGWTKLDDSYRNDGTISANVSGFSVYAAFGEEVVGASEDGIVYDSVLPGDPGISVIEMEISSPSKVYIGSNKTLDTDHTCNEPELDAEPGCTLLNGRMDRRWRRSLRSRRTNNRKCSQH